MATDPHTPSDRPRDGETLEPTVFDQPPGGSSPGSRAGERTEIFTDNEVRPVMAWLVITSQGPRQGDLVRITGSSFLIGRAGDCDLVLDDSGVARQHARIRVEQSGGDVRFVVHDLATDNGTLVNGNRQPSAELQTGDVIRIGRIELTFKRLA